MTTIQIKLLKSQGSEDGCQHASYVLKTSRLRTKSSNDEEHGAERDKYATLCVLGLHHMIALIACNLGLFREVARGSGECGFSNDFFFGGND
jgi:hypothetical protein